MVQYFVPSQSLHPYNIHVRRRTPLGMDGAGATDSGPPSTQTISGPGSASALLSILSRAPMYTASELAGSWGSGNSSYRPLQHMQSPSATENLQLPSSANYTKTFSDISDVDTPPKKHAHKSIKYSDISDPDSWTCTHDVNNNSSKFDGKIARFYSPVRDVTSSDTVFTSESSSDEFKKVSCFPKINDVKQRRKCRRKSMFPVRSAPRDDPRFRGVTVWLQTSFQKGVSKLRISAFYR